MDFIAIDFETAKHSQESACSVGLVKFQDGEIIDTYYSLIRPPVLYIRPDFTDIHGITVEDVTDAPTFEDIWDSAIRPFIGGLPLAAHFAQFDMGVLRAVLRWYDLPIPAAPYFCTCALARHSWPKLRSHALTALAGHFAINYNAHNALDDAMTCGKLVFLSAEEYGLSDTDSIERLLGAAEVVMNELY